MCPWCVLDMLGVIVIIVRAYVGLLMWGMCGFDVCGCLGDVA